MDNNHIALFFRGRGGGVGKVIPRIGECLRYKGRHVSVVAANLDKRNRLYSQIYNLNRKKLALSLPALVRFIFKKRIRLLFCAAHMPSIVGFCARLLTLNSCLIVPSIRTNLSVIILEWGVIRSQIFKLIIKIIINSSSQTVAVSGGVKEDLVHNFGVNPSVVRVIYPPVLIPELGSKGREIPSGRWFHDEEISVVLSVGRLSRQKDFLTLIRAFALLLDAHPESRLVIVGEGPERPQIEALIKEKGLDEFVWLAGHQENPYKFYTHSDLFSLTSRWGGLDNVLVEALYFGLPVVCTDFPYGPRELLEMGFLERLAPVGGVETIALQMSEGLNPVSKEKIRWKIDKLEERFSLEAVAQQHEELFREVLKSLRPGFQKYV